jgi:ABC-2 type transport system permease protein
MSAATASGPFRWLVQLWAVVVKEVRQTVQDKRIMALIVIAPFLQLVLLGFAIDLDVDQVPTIVVDMDRSRESRRAVAALMADGSLAAVGTAGSPSEADAALDRGAAAVVLIVPEGYARDLARGEATQVQVLLDGTDPTRSGIAGGAAVRYFGELGFSIAKQRLAAAAPDVHISTIDVRSRLAFNPSLSTPVYMVPGIAGMLLLIITTIVTAMGLSREREVGTLEQIRVTPLPTAVLMLGKVLPFVAVGLFDVTLALTAGVYIFDVPIRGSMLDFYIITSLFLLTTVGVGLFLAAVSKTQQQAFVGAFLFILPAILLSGTMTPIHAMPEWMQPMTLINPLRFYLEAIRAILLKGASLSDVPVQTVALLVYGLLIMGFASLLFRKRLD